MTRDKRKPKAVPLFTLYPDKLVLAKEEGGNKVSFTIRNNLPCSLAYKIQCTNPDAFKLRPVHGVLPSMGYVDIHLSLLTGANHRNHEKFLVLAAITDEKELTSEEINELFKDTTNICSQHLQCVILYKESKVREDSTPETEEGDKIDIIEKHLSKSVNMQILISVLIGICFLAILLNSA